MEVQLHVDVRMRQKAGTQTTKINREILCNGPSAKIYTLEIYPLYGIYSVKVKVRSSGQGSSIEAWQSLKIDKPIGNDR